MQKCEAVETVSDADFGYWNDEAWGPAPVHEFPCGDPATQISTFETPVGIESIHVCDAHAEATR